MSRIPDPMSRIPDPTHATPISRHASLITRHAPRSYVTHPKSHITHSRSRVTHPRVTCHASRIRFAPTAGGGGYHAVGADVHLCGASTVCWDPSSSCRRHHHPRCLTSRSHSRLTPTGSNCAGSCSPTERSRNFMLSHNF